MKKPDKKQCQAEKPTIDSMTFGGTIPSFERCKNIPTYIATEKKPPKGYKTCGSMSLCDGCKEIFLKQYGKSYAIFKRIKQGSARIRCKNGHCDFWNLFDDTCNMPSRGEHCSGQTKCLDATPKENKKKSTEECRKNCDVNLKNMKLEKRIGKLEVENKDLIEYFKLTKDACLSAIYETKKNKRRCNTG